MQITESIQIENNEMNLSYQYDNLSHSSNASQPYSHVINITSKATKISRSLPQSTIASSCHSDLSQQHVDVEQQYEFYSSYFNNNNDEQQQYCQQFHINGSCMKGTDCGYLHGNQKDKCMKNGVKLYNKMWMDFPEICLNYNINKRIVKCFRIQSFLKSMK